MVSSNVTYWTKPRTQHSVAFKKKNGVNRERGCLRVVEGGGSHASTTSPWLQPPRITALCAAPPHDPPARLRLRRHATTAITIRAGTTTNSGGGSLRTKGSEGSSIQTGDSFPLSFSSFIISIVWRHRHLPDPPSLSLVSSLGLGSRDGTSPAMRIPSPPTSLAERGKKKGLDERRRRRRRRS
jgi:hypothetical protein